MAIELVDTHCHIHDPVFRHKTLSINTQIQAARDAGVLQCICVGTDATSSSFAMKVAEEHGLYATISIHPHEVKRLTTHALELQKTELERLAAQKNSRVVAVGECGLDYYYHESGNIRQEQRDLLRWHVELAKKYDLSLMFHVRNQKDQDPDVLGDAFSDLFVVIDSFGGVRGVIHSFSAGTVELEECLSRGLYISLNGIMTFTSDENQLRAAKNVPLEKLLLETDAPFLTPKPFRGTMCEPKHVRVTAEFLSKLRGETLEQLAQVTTENAKNLFGITL
jgi:TatD DNase family protein